MKRDFLKYVILFSILVLSCTERNETIKRSTVAMGTVMEIQVRGVDEQSANKAINESFKEFKRLDTLFSTYLKNNEMWRINNSVSDTITVSDEYFFILNQCDRYWKESGGAFDPAIGNIIDLVGFEKGNPKLPSPEMIKEALKKTSWNKIKLVEPNILIKPYQIKLGFNACIPGYAADRVAQILNDNGINNFLINAGGEIFAKGNDWKIGIQHPRKQNEILNSILIDGISVSTSGDYQQYFNKNGKRYSHIFNPATGLPANELEAATIIAKDALTSDALSTAVFILGKENGIKLIEKLPGVEGLIVDTTGTIYKSSGFGKYILR